MDVTPNPTPKMERRVMKLKNFEFFLDFRYLSPTQVVHGLLQNSKKEDLVCSFLDFLVIVEFLLILSLLKDA